MATGATNGGAALTGAEIGLIGVINTDAAIAGDFAIGA